MKSPEIVALDKQIDELMSRITALVEKDSWSLPINLRKLKVLHIKVKKLVEARSILRKKV